MWANRDQIPEGVATEPFVYVTGNDSKFEKESHEQNKNSKHVTPG